MQTLFVHVSGGVVQSVTYDGAHPPALRVVLIDDDCEGTPNEELGRVTVEGEERPAWIAEMDLDAPWVESFRLNPGLEPE